MPIYGLTVPIFGHSMGFNIADRTATETEMREQMSHDALNQMQARVAAGLDPLTGRPLQVVGTVAWRNGVLCDDAGAEVTLSERGDWVPVEK